MPLQADDISRLYRDHARSLLVFLARRVYDPEVAVDLLAETFASAFVVREQFRGQDDADAVSWLYGIARNQLSHFYRRGQAERRALERLAVERRPLTEPEYERIEELAGITELRAAAAEALERLSPQHREIVRLRVVEEQPYRDVAHRLGISEQAARARLSRALREMASVRLCVSGGDSLSEAGGA